MENDISYQVRDLRVPSDVIWTGQRLSHLLKIH